jgi:galactose mutarotase-like enzyme
MITLENEKLKVTIGTGRGAKVESFIDKDTGKDWVWRPENIEKMTQGKTLGLGESFDANWEGGWEEVFPNDAPSQIEGYELVDHGEVWRRSWNKEEDESPYSAIFSINCESYPMFMKKRFTLNEYASELVIDYEIASRAIMPLPYIFKLHPALSIEAGDEVRMPEAMMEPVALGFSRILSQDKKTSFPTGFNEVGEEVTVNKILENDGDKREFVKISEFSEGRAGLINERTKKELRFTFSKDVLSQVWLFQSFGGFMNHYVSMIEPTNAGHYDLAIASEIDQCGFIKPGEKKSFSISIRLCDLKE